MRVIFNVTDTFDWNKIGFLWANNYNKFTIVIDPSTKSCPEIPRNVFILSKKVVIDDKRETGYTFDEIYEMYQNLARFTYRNEKTKTLFKGFYTIKNLDKFKGYETWGFAYCWFPNPFPVNLQKDCKKLFYCSNLIGYSFIESLLYYLRHELLEITIYQTSKISLKKLEFPKLAKFHGEPSFILNPGYLVEDILRLPSLLECGEEFRKTRQSLYNRLRSMRLMAILCLRRVIVKPVVKMICQMVTIRDVFEESQPEKKSKKK